MPNTSKPSASESLAVKKTQRVLALDFGTQYIGVAIGQTLNYNAQALTSLKAHDGIPQWPQIQIIIDEWHVDILLVGLPLHMDGSTNALCTRAKKFANRCRAHFKLPVELVDERLSSIAAQDLEIAGDIHGKSAVLIMRTWFAMHA